MKEEICSIEIPKRFYFHILLMVQKTKTFQNIHLIIILLYYESLLIFIKVILKRKVRLSAYSYKKLSSG